MNFPYYTYALFIDGGMIGGLIHSAEYADEAYDDLKKMYPNNHICIYGYMPNTQEHESHFVYKDTDRERLFNKKI